MYKLTVNHVILSALNNVKGLDGQQPGLIPATGPPACGSKGKKNLMVSIPDVNKNTPIIQLVNPAAKQSQHIYISLIFSGDEEPKKIKSSGSLTAERMPPVQG